MPVTAVSLSSLPVISYSSFHHLAPPTLTVYRVSGVGVTDNVWELRFVAEFEFLNVAILKRKKEKQQGWIFLDTFTHVSVNMFAEGGALLYVADNV